MSYRQKVLFNTQDVYFRQEFNYLGTEEFFILRFREVFEFFGSDSIFLYGMHFKSSLSGFW